MKDELCEEIYSDFLKCLFTEVEDAKKAINVAEQALQEAVRVSNTAYGDEGFKEAEYNIQVTREALIVAEEVLEDKLNVLLSIGN
jgi:HEPN domain-containing protein